MRTNIHALSRILTHGLSVQAAKAYASHHMATGTSQQELLHWAYSERVDSDMPNIMPTECRKLFLSVNNWRIQNKILGRTNLPNFPT
jgi:hypothetical protein